MTAAERLAQIDAAISALLTGGASSYSIGNRSVTKLDLKTLTDERKQLMFEVQRETSSGFSLGRMGKAR
jgi:hypothetical protein